jgi:hypothetical protein
MNALRSLPMNKRGIFIKRWNPNGWTWGRALHSTSAWIYFSKRGTFGYVYFRLICVPIVMDESCLRPSIRPLSLNITSSHADVVAPSIHDSSALMTFRVDEACGIPLIRAWPFRSADDLARRPAKTVWVRL